MLGWQEGCSLLAAVPPEGAVAGRGVALAGAKGQRAVEPARFGAGVFAGQAVEVLAAAGDPNALIARAARRRGADLIAMATHGRGAIARALLGSTAAETLRRASAPVLLARPERVDGRSPAATDAG